MDAETINKIDWSKIVMGIAVGVVFIMQQWHSIQVSNIKANLVPRTEYEARTGKAMDKAEIMDAFRDFSKRLEDLEGTK